MIGGQYNIWTLTKSPDNAQLFHALMRVIDGKMPQTQENDSMSFQVSVITTWLTQKRTEGKGECTQ